MLWMKNLLPHSHGSTRTRWLQRTSQSKHTPWRGTHACALVAAFVLMSSTADAREFRMSGDWRLLFGATLELPVFGGIGNRDGAMANATGSAPASVTIPVNAFTDPGLSIVIPIPSVTSLVQLSSMFSFNGPISPGAFAAGPKGTRPANFGWCIGAAANPNCTTAAIGGSQGTAHGLVTYTAGPNQFGGTMQMLVGGTGAFSGLIGTSPRRIEHALINAETVAQGGGFATNVSIFFPPGPVTTGAVCANGLCGDAGVIIVPGVTTAPGTGGTSTFWGFPWTTGMVSVFVNEVPTSPETVTATGFDTRTPLGAGNISMVAGGLGVFQGPAARAATSLFSTVTMTFRARNLPALSAGGIATLVSVIAMGAAYALHGRRRR
jgi:hypothetical protein